MSVRNICISTEFNIVLLVVSLYWELSNLYCLSAERTWHHETRRVESLLWTGCIEHRCSSAILQVTSARLSAFATMVAATVDSVWAAIAFSFGV